MGSINPIRKDVVSANGIENVPKGAQQTDATANKVARTANIEKLPEIGLRQRQITPLKEAKALVKEIQQVWDSLEIDKLAVKIINLEEKVLKITGTSQEAEKVRRTAEHLHFQFVHPGAKELEKGGDGTLMPFSFVQSIKEIGARMIQTNSVEPIKELNKVQISEIMRHANKRGG